MVFLRKEFIKNLISSNIVFVVPGICFLKYEQYIISFKQSADSLTLCQIN
jgi:hypothetical protein